MTLSTSQRAEEESETHEGWKKGKTAENRDRQRDSDKREEEMNSSFRKQNNRRLGIKSKVSLSSPPKSIVNESRKRGNVYVSLRQSSGKIQSFSSFLSEKKEREVSSLQ